MIGKIVSDKHGTFTLSDSGKWEGDDQRVVKALTDGFDPRKYMYPASGRFGELALSQAAKFLHGKVEGLKQWPEDEPGTIY